MFDCGTEVCGRVGHGVSTCEITYRVFPTFFFTGMLALVGWSDDRSGLDGHATGMHVGGPHPPSHHNRSSMWCARHVSQLLRCEDDAT